MIKKSFLFHAAYTENTMWTVECAVGLIVYPIALQVTVTVNPVVMKSHYSEIGRLQLTHVVLTHVIQFILQW